MQKRRRHRRKWWKRLRLPAAPLVVTSFFLLFLATLAWHVLGLRLPRSASWVAAGASTYSHPAVPVVHSPSSDPALASLISIGSWKGSYRAGATYHIGDLVSDGGRFYFAWREGAALNDGFEPVPVVEHETVAFDESFEEEPGRFSPTRSINDQYKWTLTGDGYPNADVNPGYATSSGNTYFVVNAIPRRISEFGSEVLIDSEDGVATMALQRDGFGEMLHVNWYTRGVGATTYWHAGTADQNPPFRYAWNSRAQLRVGVTQQLTLRIRGNFLFGYLNGALAFVLLHEVIGQYAGNASSIYVQNHPAISGAERQERVWVKLRE